MACLLLRMRPLPPKTSAETGYVCMYICTAHDPSAPGRGDARCVWLKYLLYWGPTRGWGGEPFEQQQEQELRGSFMLRVITCRRRALRWFSARTHGKKGGGEEEEEGGGTIGRFRRWFMEAPLARLLGCVLGFTSGCGGSTFYFLLGLRSWRIFVGEGRG